MQSFYLSVGIILSFALSATAEEDNPFRTAKVGDWVEYKIVSKAKETVDATQKMTLTAKNDKNATVRVVTTIKDSSSTHDLSIDLTKPFDVTDSPITDPMAKSGMKIEKVKNGTEKIKAAGEEFNCSYVKSKVTGKIMNLSFENEVTVWVSKDVPLAGMVKLEMKAASSASVTMELSQFGHEKK